MIEFVVAGIFLTLFLLIIGVYFAISKKVFSSERQIKHRLSDLLNDKSLNESDISRILRDDSFSEIKFFNRILQNAKISQKLSLLLEQANVKMKVGQLLLLMVILGTIGFLFTQNSSNYLMMGGISIFLFFAPLLFIIQKRNKRMKLFTVQFPDAIDMMKSALQAGHAFSKAMQLVANEAPDPVGTEFRKTYEENSLGIPLKDALISLSQRIDNVDLNLFITSVLLQRETGGNLTEMLDKISLTIRDRFKLLGQIKTFTAQARMSAMVLGVLPIIFIIFASAANPDYLTPLFQEKIGHNLLFAAITMQIIGFLLLKKIVKIKLN